MNTSDNRAPIGITAIWGEADGVEGVSLTAVASHCIRQSIENVRRSPITHILTIVTIGIAIFLLGVFSLVIHNSSIAVARESGEMEVMVFLKDEAGRSDIEVLQRKIGEVAPQRTIVHVTKAEALHSFRQMLGEEAAMLEGLDAENPLPASLNIKLRSASEAEAVYSSIRDTLSGNSMVESVRYSRGGVNQIKKMIRVVEAVGMVGMVFLFVIAGFIIANTIKLALYNHRAEIEIMELVGARPREIFAPFMLEGFVQGLFGAGCGLACVAIVFALCRGFLDQAELLRMVFPSFTFIPLGQVLLVLLAGALVGVAGSFLAVRRFLTEA